MSIRHSLVLCCWMTTLVVGFGPANAAAQPGGRVRITPLGTHAGELCSRDRAMVFEDPTGVRILYDPGFTVDETDARLGDIDVILLSHAHADHLGRARAAGGTCAAPAMSAVANPTVATIAAVKNAAVVASNGLQAFVAQKIQNFRRSPTPGCAASGPTNELVVPLAAPCTAPLNPGGSRTVRRVGGTGGVRLAVVPAFHTNEAPPAFLDPPGTPPGTSAYVGIDTGFVLTFTNGLTAYLTGDSGLFGDMETIIRRYYNPKLVVMNIGDVFTLGPSTTLSDSQIDFREFLHGS